MIASALYYWLKCDNCGVSSCDGEDVSAWSALDVAIEQAENADWIVEEHLHLCPKPECGGKHFCPECGERKPPGVTLCAECVDTTDDTATEAPAS